MCLNNHDTRRARILFEFGARVDTYDTPEETAPADTREWHLGDNWLLDPDLSDVDFISRNTPLTTAVSAAALLRSLPVLELLLTEARARGCLSDMIESTFPNDVSDASEFTPCLLHVCKADFAPVLELLLDAGLDPTRLIAVPWKRCFDKGPSSYATLLRAAAQVDAIACVRLLHKRLTPGQWRAALAGPAALTGIGPDVFEYFLSHSGQGTIPYSDIPDSLVQGLASLLTRLSGSERKCLFDHSDGDHSDGDSDAGAGGAGRAEDEARARAAAAAWDQSTQTEMLVALAELARTGGIALPGSLCPFLVRNGWLRAFAAARELGFTCDWQMVLCGPVSAVQARAVISAAATVDPGGALAVRRSIRALFPIDCTPNHNSEPYVQRLITSGNLALACVLIEAGAPVPHAQGVNSVFYWLSQAYMRGHDAVAALAAARAALASLRGDGVSAPLSGDVSGLAFSVAVATGQLALAKLYLSAGADLFSLSYALELQVRQVARANFTALQRLRLPAVTLPPSASPDVEAAGEHAAAAAFTDVSARAHAAAAAAEETRLLAALLHSPSCFDHLFQTRYHRKSWLLDELARVPEWATWVASVRPVLVARWVWDRMLECDRARAQKGFPGQALFSAALEAGDARTTRALAQFCTTSDPSNMVFLQSACGQGAYEFAWAVLHAVTRTGAPAPAEAGLTEALWSLIAGVSRNGHRFAQGLADALVGAGARVRGSTVQALCAAQCQRPAPVPGEVGRALRWTLIAVRNDAAM